MKEKIIAQAAEAIIIQKDKTIIKRRIAKGYRLPVLDEKLRKLRTRSESKLLEKASKIIPVPKVIKVDEKTKEIEMEFIHGKKLSENLDKLQDKEKIMQTLGSEIAKLHDNNIIHGDLTTSNMILKGKEIYIIDFGLGFVSLRVEDKAVDLHLLKQALEAKHYQNWEKLYESFLKGYKSKEKSKIIAQLEEVESRGRYKH